MRTDFHRRVVGHARGFPMLLLWIVFRPPGQACPGRQRCARDLLVLPVSVSDDFTLKYRRP
eukprot:14584035-Alexandrium_andersonii.AAC.1